MDALGLIRDDHTKFRKLLGELDETTERAVKTRAELFARLKREIVSHEEMEEKIFYPALREAREKAEDKVLEGYEEHRLADFVVEEMSELPTDDETWGAKLTVLKESLEHHMQEEEGDMFEQARKAFDRAELERLGALMAEVKKAALDALAA